MKRFTKSLASAAIAALMGFSWTSQADASDVLVVADFSGSMSEKTSDGVRRIDAAKATLPKLSTILENEDVGLMLFGHRVNGNVKPDCCSDIEMKLPIAPMAEQDFEAAVSQLQPLGATPLAESLNAAGEYLVNRETETPKSIIVLTDGNDTCGGNPAAVAKRLRELGINVEIHVVGFGVNQQQEQQLRELAESGGGQFVVANDAVELEAALTRVATLSIKQTQIVEVSRKVVAEDEFAGEELNSNWKVDRPDIDRIAIIDGELLVVTQHNDKWTDHTKVKNFVRRVEAINANDYEVSVDMGLKITMQHHAGALVLQQDEQNYIELAFVGQPHGYNVKRVLRLRKCVEGQINDWVYDYVIGSSAEVETVTLKIKKQGNIFRGLAKIKHSKSDGTRWFEVGEQSAPTLTSLTPVLKAANASPNHYGSGKVTETDATFDNFSIVETELKRIVSGPSTDDAWFATDFDSPDGFSNDFKVVNSSRTHLGIGNGLSIVTQFGQFRSVQNPVQNLTVLDRDLPAGDYDIEVQTTGRISSQNNDFGIALIQDEDTMLRVGHVGVPWGYNTNRRNYFEKTVRGEVDKIVEETHRFSDAGEDRTFVFRIEKRSRKYTAKVWSLNEKTKKMEWVELGSYTMLRFAPKLALVATNHSKDHYGAGQAHEINARFDRVVIRER